MYRSLGAKDFRRPCRHDQERLDTKWSSMARQSLSYIHVATYSRVTPCCLPNDIWWELLARPCLTPISRLSKYEQMGIVGKTLFDPHQPLKQV
jgi:hypothetical protein